MKNFAKILSKPKNLFTLIFGFATFLTFFAPNDWSSEIFSPFNFLRFAIMLIFIGLVLSYKTPVNFQNSISTAPKFAKILMIVLPILITFFAIIQVLNPDFATWLVRCDNMKICGLNFRHAIFVKAVFELVSCGLFAILAVKFAKKKQLFPVIIFAILAFVVFVLAGEELSWGQRIFDFATPENFREINAQHEFNLHDMATQLFQNVWYLGSWILLIALPFFREPLTKFFAKNPKFSFFAKLLPPTYFILIFAAAFGFVDPVWSETGIRWSSLLFMILASGAILAKIIIPARERLAERICLTFGAFLITLFANLFISEVWNKNSGAPGEYLETFLAFGIMFWAIYVFRNFCENPLKTSRKIPEKSVKLSRKKSKKS